MGGWVLPIDPGGFGATLREIRRNLGLSLRELAGLSGVSHETIRQAEIGQHRPTLETCGKIAAGHARAIQEMIRAFAEG